MVVCRGPVTGMAVFRCQLIPPQSIKANPSTNVMAMNRIARDSLLHMASVAVYGELPGFTYRKTSHHLVLPYTS